MTHAFTRDLNYLIGLTGKTGHQLAICSSLPDYEWHRWRHGERSNPAYDRLVQITVGIVGNKTLIKAHPELALTYQILAAALLEDATLATAQKEQAQSQRRLHRASALR